MTVIVCLMSSVLFDSLAQSINYRDSLFFYHDRNEPEKTLYYFNKVLEQNPRSTFYLLHKGAFLHELERHREAVTEFSKAIAVNPDLTDAYVRRGISFLAIPKYDSSILDFSKALGKHRYQDSVIFKYRGLAFLSTGQFERALLDYDSAIKFNDHDKDILNNRSNTRAKLGDLHGALQDLNRAIIVDPTYVLARKNRLMIFAQLGDLDSALLDGRFCLSKIPGDEQVNLVVGSIHFDKKEFGKAISYFEKSKGMKGTDVYRLCGLSYHYTGRYQDAIKNLEMALRLGVQNSYEADTYFVLGISKNNLNPKSGCPDISKAVEKGHADGKAEYGKACK
jgi:tetratricopeptide (TPR) repeat protein